jgi:hypothetical protein
MKTIKFKHWVYEARRKKRLEEFRKHTVIINKLYEELFFLKHDITITVK